MSWMFFGREALDLGFEKKRNRKSKPNNNIVDRLHPPEHF